MPTLFLQVGQAGNQIGGELWQLVGTEIGGWGKQRDGTEKASTAESLRRKWSSLIDFDQDLPRARSLLIDSEPKAVEAVSSVSKLRSAFRPANVITGHSGRGNNWALGYNGPPSRAEVSRAWRGSGSTGTNLKEERGLADRAEDAVRKEAERTDWPIDFAVVHSLAGGTGSGLGSRLLEFLADDYGRCYRVSVAVAPRMEGDTPLQSYNMTLATQFLQCYTDAVLLFQNADLLRSLEGRRGASVAMLDLNQYIAACLAGVLFPLPASSCGFRPAASPIRDLVTSVCPDPALKFAEVRTNLPPVRRQVAASQPFLQASSGLAPPPLWQNIARAMAPLVPKFDVLDEGTAITSASSLLTLRGPDDTDPRAKAAAEGEVLKALGSSYTHVSWNPAPWECRFAVRRPVPPAKSGAGSIGGSFSASRSVTVASNRSNVTGLLQTAAERADYMLQARAYVHWYERNGCPVEALEEAVVATWDVVDAVRSAHAK